MSQIRSWFFIVFVVILAIGWVPAVAQNSYPMPDPGFTFVDMDGDGLYSPSIDVGLTSTVQAVDIDALIRYDGKFDTQASKNIGGQLGKYVATCKTASLVIPASVTITEPVSGNGITALNLRAGLHVIVHGSLSASTIALTACGNLDLTNSSITFVSKLTGQAAGNATLNGMAAAGDTSVGQIAIVANLNLNADLGTYGGASLIAGTTINLQALAAMHMEGAFLYANAPKAIVLAVSGTAMSVDQSGILAANGTITASSARGAATVTNDDWVAATITTTASSNLSLTGSSFTCSGLLKAQSGANLTALAGTSFTSGSFSLSGVSGIDLTDSTLIASTGSATIASSRGSVTVNYVHLQANSSGATVQITAGSLMIYAMHFDVAPTPIYGPAGVYVGTM